jgi:hypothetical protein
MAKRLEMRSAVFPWLPIETGVVLEDYFPSFGIRRWVCETH